MFRLMRRLLVAVISASFCGNAFGHNDHFGGVTSNFNDPANWSLGVPNAGEWMEFSPAWSTGPSGNLLDMNVAGSALGIYVDAFGGVSGNISINGPGALT